MSGITGVNPARFEHGTRARYVAARCRCEPCRRANARYAKSRRRGEPNPLVDGAEARARVEELRARGLGLRSIASEAKLGRTVLQRLMSGARVRAAVARAVLSVPAHGPRCPWRKAIPTGSPCSCRGLPVLEFPVSAHAQPTDKRRA